MAEINPPGFLQNRTDHSARIMRRAISGLIASEGIVTAGSWAVSQRGAGANMSVDIAGGEGYIKGDEDVTQGFYHCMSDVTVINKTITTAHATLPRKDIVVARVYDAFYSGGTNLWQVEVVTGTAAASPAIPATPNNALLLGVISVAAAASSIVTANIDTTRAALALLGSTASIFFNQLVASYTLVLADANKQVEILTTGASTLTVPPNSSVPFPVGTMIMFAQTGAGQVTITPGAGVTINGTPGLKTRTQWSVGSLVKRGTDLWLASGDLVA